MASGKDFDELLAVAQAERALAEAHLSLDLAIFDRLLHKDYVVIQPGGLTRDKAETLASLRGGTRHWDRASVDQLDIRLYDGTAVVTGRWSASGRNGAASFDEQARFLSVWVREDGRWQNVAYQSTDIPTG
jgi:hypothetical protein